MKRKWYTDGADCLIACICSLTNIRKEQFNVEWVKRVNEQCYDPRSYFYIAGYYNSIYKTVVKNGYWLDLSTSVKHKHAIGILRVINKKNYWYSRHAVIINKKLQIIHDPTIRDSLKSGKYIYGLESIYNIEKT